MDNNFANNQEMPNQQPQPTKLTPYSMSELNDLMEHRVTYPEMYYRCQPFVMLACDQMDTYSSEMPTQEMLDQMSDNVVNDVSQMYPDMAEYAKSVEPKASVPAQEFPSFDRDRDRDRYRDNDMFRRRFRRRGPFRDFISFLLLSELLKRRRRFY